MSFLGVCTAKFCEKFQVLLHSPKKSLKIHTLIYGGPLAIGDSKRESMPGGEFMEKGQSPPCCCRSFFGYCGLPIIETLTKRATFSHWEWPRTNRPIIPSIYCTSSKLSQKRPKFKASKNCWAIYVRAMCCFTCPFPLQRLTFSTQTAEAALTLSGDSVVN